MPTLTQTHCDMGAFRTHSTYGTYANSDIFPNILARVRGRMFGERNSLYLDAIPEGVTTEPIGNGFMMKVSFIAPDKWR